MQPAGRREHAAANPWNRRCRVVRPVPNELTAAAIERLVFLVLAPSIHPSRRQFLHTFAL